MQPGTAMCFLNFYTLVFWPPLMNTAKKMCLLWHIFQMTEMEPAPPVGFNLTFVCPEGQVFDHDWWENIANAQQIQGWVFLCFCQTNYCKCFTQHQNQHQWQLQQVLSCHSHMGPMCSLRLNSHQSCPNNISKWGQTMHYAIRADIFGRWRFSRTKWVSKFLFL